MPEAAQLVVSVDHRKLRRELVSAARLTSKLRDHGMRDEARQWAQLQGNGEISHAGSIAAAIASRHGADKVCL